MDRLDLFRNLVLMAAADGALTQLEIQFLSDRSRRWGISDSDFAHVIEEALAPDCQLELPSKHEDRRELLKELLRMMAADGKLAPEEKRIFASAAVVMNFSQAQIDALIDETLEGE